jgi:hypothetical protein
LNIFVLTLLAYALVAAIAAGPLLVTLLLPLATLIASLPSVNALQMLRYRSTTDLRGTDLLAPRLSNILRRALRIHRSSVICRGWSWWIPRVVCHRANSILIRWMIWQAIRRYIAVYMRILIWLP